MLSKRSVIAAAMFLTSSVMVRTATADLYPNRLVTLVVPAPAGSTPDILARLLAERLWPILGQNFIVENRPGAGGTTGAEFVARAAPDGYVLLCTVEWLFFSHLLHKKLTFDPRAFEPVSLVAKYPLILIARRDAPVSNIAELVTYARAHPGKLNYASSGVGSMHQLVYEAIKKQAQIDLTHVPYRGGPLAINDLLAGHVDVSLTSLNQGAPHVKDGKLKLLGIVSDARLPEFPQAQALTEVLPGLSADAWTGIAAPPRTPKEITSKLSEAIAQILQMPALRTRFSELLIEPVGSTPEQMNAIVRKDEARWAPVVAAAKISID